MKRMMQLLIFLVVTVLFVIGQAQKMLIMSAGDGAAPLLMEEIGVIVNEENNQLQIMAVLPNRPGGKKVQQTDIRKGDVLLMMNAKRIKKVEDLKKAYGNIPVGKDIKLGLERDNKMFMVSFKKEEMKVEEKRQMMMKLDAGSGKNPRPWLETGFLLAEQNGKVKVADILPGVSATLTLEGIQKGAVIDQFDNQQVKTVKQFFDLYDAAGGRDELNLVFIQNGKKLRRVFNKPESKGNVMIHEEKN